MTSFLSALPVELVERVAFQLESSDLQSLRLVCTEAYRSTLNCFGHICLASFTTDLSRESLERLKDLSQHKKLRHYVKFLLITDEKGVGQGFTDDEGFGQGYTWPRHPSGRLVAPLPGVEMLQDILIEGLIECRSFQIHRKYIMEYPDDPNELVYSDAIAILFLVIGETGLPIRSLQLDCESDGNPNSIDVDRVDSQDIQTPQFWTGWAHLEELDLHITMSSDALLWTADLVLRAPNLRKLRIGYNLCNDGETVSFFRILHFASTLPKLQELILSHLCFTEDFIAFESAFPRQLHPPQGGSDAPYGWGDARC
ncbi:hypothetical protein MMC27_002584 [Xylographa pallens]|nr:hypothetical protein [Xylographa pallens]